MAHPHAGRLWDYLAAAGRILFDLEWDRATESLARLRQKVGSYVGHFEHYRLLTPPPEVRETIVDLRLAGPPGFPGLRLSQGTVRLVSGSTPGRRTKSSPNANQPVTVPARGLADSTNGYSPRRPAAGSAV